MGNIMKILVTGAKGFVGKNLVLGLKNKGYSEILEYDTDSEPGILKTYCKDCSFVYHLAGINRPECDEEYMKGNYGLTSDLLNALEEADNTSPIMLSSSIQAECDNSYGKSKKAGEELLTLYGKTKGLPVYIYRFPNLFGKWSRPDYNSVVATFCYRIARGAAFQINDPSVSLELLYIDDVVDELISLLEQKGHHVSGDFYHVPESHRVTVGELSEIIRSFRDSRLNKQIMDMTPGSFSKKLYSTYLSYLPEDAFKYALEMHRDERGSFTEIFRTLDRGQISVNISKPGSEKGNHWHNTKNEKFIVVSGDALIQFRKPGEENVFSYHVTGDKLEVVDIPVGYTHNIINEGNNDLITLMWCNECFDLKKPDTYSMPVNSNSSAESVN